LAFAGSVDPYAAFRFPRRRSQGSAGAGPRPAADTRCAPTCPTPHGHHQARTPPDPRELRPICHGLPDHGRCALRQRPLVARLSRPSGRKARYSRPAEDCRRMVSLDRPVPSRPDVLHLDLQRHSACAGDATPPRTAYPDLGRISQRDPAGRHVVGTRVESPDRPRIWSPTWPPVTLRRRQTMSADAGPENIPCNPNTVRSGPWR